MNLIAIIKYLPYLLKVLSIILDHLKGIKSDKDRESFVKEMEAAFEKAKSGDTSDLERLFNNSK